MIVNRLLSNVRGVLLLLGLLFFVGLPDSAAAQLAEELTAPDEATAGATSSDRRADPATVARMAEVLEERARGERVSSTVNGVINLGVGAFLIGSSLWLALDVDAFGGFGGPGPGVITGLAVAPMMIASGIYSLLGVQSNGDRLLRWRMAMNGELSAIELGRFEGELRAEANAARVSRWGSFALGVGILAGGLVTMILGAAFEDFDDEFRAITIGGGGGFAVIGGVMMGTSFLESSVEQMWRTYQRGSAAPTAGVNVRPVFGLGSVGLVGTF